VVIACKYYPVARSTAVDWERSGLDAMYRLAAEPARHMCGPVSFVRTFGFGLADESN
jgi:hypothetical protein